MNDTIPSHEARSDSDRPRNSLPVLITFAWLFVGVPLAWGVTQTAVKSADLFRSPQAQTGAGASPAPAPAAPSAPAQPARSP
jgi:hypothetical protein